jgi:ABC-type uncharacterized transport system ATPase subunit
VTAPAHTTWDTKETITALTMLHDRRCFDWVNRMKEVILMDQKNVEIVFQPARRGFASTAKIEDLMTGLKKKYTVIIVTHNMQQATRTSDQTAFFYMGELVEFGDTKKIVSYNAATKTATVDSNFSVVPTTSSNFTLRFGTKDVETIANTSTGTTTVSAYAGINVGVYVARYPQANTLLKEALFIFHRTMGC